MEATSSVQYVSTLERSLNIYVTAVAGSAESKLHSNWIAVLTQSGARFVRLIHANRFPLL